MTKPLLVKVRFPDGSVRGLVPVDTINPYLPITKPPKLCFDEPGFEVIETGDGQFNAIWRG